MVVYLKNSIKSLLSVFKKKAGPRRNEEQKGLSVHYRASQHYPENVFIEGNRSQYLEDLHTEAQEGLKNLQQEEHHVDGSFLDDQSVSSTNTLRPEQDVYSLDSGCSPEPGVNTGSFVTTSATSTRPVLTRQASTFKPLNSTETLKRPDKSRKNRRTTIMGIPQQVQREIALQRSSTFQPIVSPQLTNGDEQVNDSLSGVLVIPTINGETPVANQEGARVNLSDLEVSREDLLLRKHLQAVYQEGQLSNPQDPGYHLMTTISQRPKSLAVPGMTTSSSTFSFLHEPQGPVMSISPQATYLSKIIPNAVLPASIEVIQINRRGSRVLGGVGIHGGSVRAMSKSSLMSADSSVSPVSSRRSDGDGSNADNSQTSSTVLEFNCSRSLSSSEMTPSNTSAVFTKQSADVVNPHATVSLAVQGCPPAEPNGGQDHVSVCSSMSWMSSPSENPGSPGKAQGPDCDASGSVSGGEDMRGGHSFTRNLSVVKTKLPPAPPQRTNSLHGNKVKKNSNDHLVMKDTTDPVSGVANASAESVPSQTEVQSVISESTRVEPQSASVAESSVERTGVSSCSFNSFPDSNSGAGEPLNPPSVSSSSLQKTRSEGSNSERTMSPSSGYSSRSGTPTLSPKGISPTSPDKQKKRPVKPGRSGSRASSSPASPSSSLTSLSSSSSDPTNSEVPVNTPSPAQQESPPLTEKFTQVCFSASFADREMFHIPPPPKVKAPCAPPPEVWAHSKPSVELLLGPPSYSSRPVSTKTHSSQTTQTQTEANQEALTMDVIQASESKEAVPQEKTLLEDIMETVTQVLDSREGSCLAPKKVYPTTDVHWEEQSSNPSKKDTERPEKTLKKQPPPVMKKTIPGTIMDELLSRRKSVEEQLQLQPECNYIRHDYVARQDPAALLQPDIEISQREDETVTPMQTLAVETPDTNEKVQKGSPPPSPPPAYHPTPPPSRKTPPSPISIHSSAVLEGVQEEAQAVDTCWPPPPPPPLEGDMVFEGGDEVDFPPPPPFVTEIPPDVINGCISAAKGPDQPGAALVEAELMTENSGSTVGPNDKTEGMSIDKPAEEEREPLEGATQCPDITYTDLETPYTLPQDILSLPEVVPPPPKEAPSPPTPITTSEIPPSNTTLVPLSSVSPAHLTPNKGPAPTETHVSAPLSPPAIVPQAPSPPADNKCTSVNFRRHPSLANTRSKEILSRHKSVPIPKEDANIPLVTPSLLQMVRLRTVSMAEDELSATPTEDHNKPSDEVLKSPQDNCVVPTSGAQSTPQKPIRKSLSYKSAHTVKTSTVTLKSPSMRLQEAIRMKTAAMSSRDCLPSRFGSRLTMGSGIGESGTLDTPKSSASTASFIFSKSTKKVVIETASSPEAQAGLKQSLATELMQATDRKDTTAYNGEVKWDKVPPPVAKKPAHGSAAPSHHQESRMEVNMETTATTVTPDTIETLF